MEVFKHYEELTGRMVDVVTLEDAMAMADEVRQAVIEEFRMKLGKAIDDIEIREVLAEYVQ